MAFVIEIGNQQNNVSIPVGAIDGYVGFDEVLTGGLFQYP